MAMSEAENSRRYRERHPERAKANARRWRIANPEKVNAIVRRSRARYPAHYRAYQLARLAANRSVIDAAKALGCVDCGEKDIRCIDLDHVRGTKVSGLAGMTGHSRAKVLAEIAKCEPRCSNCHRKRTAERLALTKSAA